MFPSKQIIDFNVEQAWNDGDFMGKGSFGEVHSAYFGYEGIERVAIKKMLKSEVDLKEMDAMIEFSPLNVGPTLFGCQFNSIYLYVVQTLLYKDLDNITIKYRMMAMKNSEFLERIRDAVEGLSIMWDNQYAHNDIKEANIMTDRELKKLTLIDFGLATKLIEGLLCQGSPLYFSPRKWRRGKKDIAPKDDLYSIAIMVGQLLAPNGYNDISREVLVNNFSYQITDVCFSMNFNPNCQVVFKTNIRNVLQEANYGNYHRSDGLRTKEKINFTTLIAMLLGYEEYKFDYKQTLEILDRLIAQFKIYETEGPGKYKKEYRDSRIYQDVGDYPDEYIFGRKYPHIPVEFQKEFEAEYFRALKLEEQENKKKEEIRLQKQEERRLIREKEEKQKALELEQQRIKEEQLKQQKNREAQEALKREMERKQKEIDELNKLAAPIQNYQRKQLLLENKLVNIMNNDKKLSRNFHQNKDKLFNGINQANVENTIEKVKVVHANFAGKNDVIVTPIAAADIWNYLGKNKFVANAKPKILTYREVLDDYLRQNPNYIEEDMVLYRVENGQQKYVIPPGFSPEDNTLYKNRMNQLMRKKCDEDNKRMAEERKNQIRRPGFNLVGRRPIAVNALM